MNDDRPDPEPGEDRPAPPPEWRVDRSASRERLRNYDPAAERKGQRVGGWLIYTDEHGAQRRIPSEVGELSSAEIASAANALSSELGAAELSYATLAAIERLTELRSAGTISEETYLREKRRLQDFG
jgi:hypothetical protein